MSSFEIIAAPTEDHNENIEVILLWILDKDTSILGEVDKTLRYAYGMWESYGYRVTVWTMCQTPLWTEMQKQGFKISYLNNYINENEYLKNLFSVEIPLYLRIDVAKMIIPYFVMKRKSYGLWNFSRQSSAPMFCIVADIDITDSKDINDACGKDGNSISLEKQHLLSLAMKKRLKTHGFLMGLGAWGHENWLLIFKNEKEILRSIEDFFIKSKIKYYSSQAVWTILPVFLRYTQLLRGKMGFYEDEDEDEDKKVIDIYRVLEKLWILQFSECFSNSILQSRWLFSS